MMYVIKNVDNGKYVACRQYIEFTGSSFTDRLQNARIFTIEEAAGSHMCGDDIMLTVFEILQDNIDNSRR